MSRRRFQPGSSLRSHLAGRAFAVVCLGCLAGLAAAQVAAQSPEEAPDETRSSTRVADRLVAVVDEDPIFLSDLDRAIALSLPSETSDEAPPAVIEFPRRLPDDPTALEALRRRTLDRLIDQRLRSHEVDRYEMGEVSAAAVEEQLALLARQAGGPSALAAELDALGLGLDGLRALLRRQLGILAYVEERLGPRVMVDPEAVRSYYDEVLGPEMTRRGESLPPLADVRPAIRAVLREEALNREIEEWTEELRDDAQIVDLFDRDPTRPLPPVVLRVDGDL